MAYKFLHLGVLFMNGPKHEVVDAVLKTATFNTGDDWVRYAHNCWIIWTNRSARDYGAVIHANLKNNDQFFISALEITDHQGVLSQWIWDWMTAKMKQERHNPLIPNPTFLPAS